MLHRYKISLFHGKDNATKTEEIVCGEHIFALDAVQAFMKAYFPFEQLYGYLRPEQNEDLTWVWSIATSASGQRIWIRKLPRETNEQ